MWDRVFLGSGASATYWLGVDYTSTANDDTVIYDMSLDGQGGIFISGMSNGIVFASKYTSSGSLNWSKTLVPSGNSVNWIRAASYNGDLYVVASKISGSQSLLLRVNGTTGNITWQRRVEASYNIFNNNDIFVDSNGVLLAGTRGENRQGVYGRFSLTDGSFMAGATFGTNNSSWDVSFGQARGIASDSNGNVYVSGAGDYPSGTRYFVTYKYDSTFNLSYFKSLSVGSSAPLLAVSNSGDSYACGGSGNRYSDLVKRNSSGVLQFNKQLFYNASGTYYGIEPKCMTYSSTGHVYVGFDNIFVDAYPSVYRMYISKLDTIGNIIWNRALYFGEGSTRIESINCDDIGDIYLSGYMVLSSGYRRGVFAKIPADGGKTGNYTLNGRTVTYAASSILTSSDYTGGTDGNSPLNSGGWGIAYDDGGSTTADKTFIVDRLTI